MQERLPLLRHKAFKSERTALSADGWEKIEKTVEAVVVDLVKQIKSGNIAAKPRVKGSKSPCSYCPFKPVCRTVGKK